MRLARAPDASARSPDRRCGPDPAVLLQRNREQHPSARHEDTSPGCNGCGTMPSRHQALPVFFGDDGADNIPDERDRITQLRLGIPGTTRRPRRGSRASAPRINHSLASFRTAGRNVVCLDGYHAVSLQERRQRVKRTDRTALHPHPLSCRTLRLSLRPRRTDGSGPQSRVKPRPAIDSRTGRCYVSRLSHDHTVPNHGRRDETGPRHPLRGELEALRHAGIRAADRLRHPPRARQHRPRERLDPAGPRLLVRGDGHHHPERAPAPRRLPREGDPGRLHHHRLRQRGRAVPRLGAVAAQDPGRAPSFRHRAGRDRRSDRADRRRDGDRQEARERLPRHLPRRVPARRAGGYGAPHRGHDVRVRAQYHRGRDRRRLPAHRRSRSGGGPHRRRR